MWYSDITTVCEETSTKKKTVHHQWILENAGEPVSLCWIFLIVIICFMYDIVTCIYRAANVPWEVFIRGIDEDILRIYSEEKKVQPVCDENIKDAMHVQIK